MPGVEFTLFREADGLILGAGNASSEDIADAQANATVGVLKGFRGDPASEKVKLPERDQLVALPLLGTTPDTSMPPAGGEVEFSGITEPSVVLVAGREVARTDGVTTTLSVLFEERGLVVVTIRPESGAYAAESHEIQVT